MSTGLIVFSLTYKCAFYEPEHYEKGLSFIGLEMQK